MTAELPPTDATLRRFLLGDLPPAELEAVGRYLDDHPHVASTLVEMKADDTLLSALRGPAEASDAPEVAAAVARAAGLVGGEPPTESLAPPPVGDPTADEVADAVAAVTDADADDPFAALAPAEADGELGRLGGYRVLRLLGQGGMGAVFEAADDRLGRRVALKVMLPALAARPAYRQRFLREARAAAAVEHDHIVPIYQTGEDRGVPFLAMPLLAGETLDARLHGGRPLAVADVLRIGREVAEGLAAAHAAGLVHRDIKPSNIWLERTADGAFKRTRILDFGLARTATGADGLTQSGAVLGTPAYMAPEQARGEAVDARADLFSLGVVLYHAATGRRPFPGADTFSILTALATTEPQPAATVNPAVPAGLSALITRLLAKNPAGRPASARAVADELARLAAEPARDSITHVAGTGSALPPTAGRPGGDTTEAFEPAAPRRASRRRWRVAAAVLFVAVAGLAAANGPTIVRVATNQGELVVEVDDPATEVAVKGGAVELRREEGGKKRVYLVTATKDGEVEVREPGSADVLVMEKFQLRRGGDVLVKVTAEKLAAARLPKAGTPPTAPATDHDRRLAEWVRSRGGYWEAELAGSRHSYGPGNRDFPVGPFKLRSIDVNGGAQPAFRPEDVELFRGVIGLTSVQLCDLEFNDQTLSRLIDLLPDSLTRIGLIQRFSKARISDAGLAGIGRLTNLKELLIESQLVTDTTCTRLRMHPQAHQVYLGGTAITDRGMVHLKGLRSLSSLHLPENTGDESARLFLDPPSGKLAVLSFGKNCTPALLPLVGKNVSLTHLGGFPATTTDRDLLHIKELPALEVLRLQNTRVTGVTLPELRSRTNVYQIDLEATPVTDENLARLKEFPALRTLNVSVTAVGDAGVAHVSGLGNLTALSIRATAVSDVGLEQLQRAKSLRALEIHRTKVTEHGVKKLAAARPDLRIEWDGPTIEPKASPAADPDRRLAEWVRGLGGNWAVGLAGTDRAHGPDNPDFPAGPFKVQWIDVRGPGKQATIRPEDVPEFRGVTELKSVELREFNDLALPRVIDQLPDGLERLVLITWHITPKISDAGLAGIGRLKNLKNVDISSSLVTDATCERLRLHPRAGGLSLEGPAITDRGMAHLAGLQSVTLLGLPENTGDEAARPFLATGKLQHLRLGKKCIPAVLPLVGKNVELAGLKGLPAATTDADLLHLKDLPALERFYLSGTRVTGATLLELRSRATVWDLALDSTPVTDDSLAQLKAFPKLRGLQLSNTPVRDAGVAHLAGIDTLAELTLTDTAVTDAGLDHLRGAKRLRQLAVGGTKVTEAGVKKLAAARPDLRITWDGPTIEPKASPPASAPLSPAQRKAVEWVLANGGQLAVVKDGRQFPIGGPDGESGPLPPEPLRVVRVTLLKGFPLTPEARAALADLPPTVRLFGLYQGAAATDAELDALTRQPWFAGVESVRLIGQVALTDAGLAHLTRAPNLQDVGLAQLPQVTDRGLEHLRALPLVTLTIEDAPQLTGAFLTADGRWRTLANLYWSRGSPSLREAELAHLAGYPGLKTAGFGSNDRVTDGGLDHLAKCKSLRELDLRKTTVTKAGAEKLAAARPDLRIEWDGATIEPKASPAAAVAALLAAGFTVKVQDPDGAFRDVKAAGDLRPGSRLAQLARTAPAGPLDPAALAALRAVPPDWPTKMILQLTGPVTADQMRLAAEAPLAPTVSILYLNQTGLQAAGYVHLARFDTLRGLHVGAGVPEAAPPDDAALKAIAAAAPKVESLTLNDSKVTGAGLAALRPLRLGVLTLQGCKGVDDAGAAPLAEMRTLTNLNLSGAAVTDAAAPHLVRLPALRELGLTGTKVTAAGVARLREALPNCRIVWSGPTVEPRPAP